MKYKRGVVRLNDKLTLRECHFIKLTINYSAIYRNIYSSYIRFLFILDKYLITTIIYG